MVEGTLIVALITAVGSFIGMIVNAITKANKSQYESLSGVVMALQQTVDQLQDENGRLRKRVEELERENRGLREQIDSLRQENVQLRQQLAQVGKARGL